MIFLGMARKPKTKEEMKNDPIEQMKKIEAERKMVQTTNMDEYHLGKDDLKDEIIDNEGMDIQE